MWIKFWYALTHQTPFVMLSVMRSNMLYVMILYGVLYVDNH
jgi:hypothetical protein